MLSAELVVSDSTWASPAATIIPALSAQARRRPPGNVRLPGSDWFDHNPPLKTWPTCGSEAEPSAAIGQLQVAHVIG
eukprot:177853-Hanusia_phi.AAC.2